MQRQVVIVYRVAVCVIAARDVTDRHLRVGAGIEGGAVAGIRRGEGIDMVGPTVADIEVRSARRVEDLDGDGASSAHHAFFEIAIGHVIGDWQDADGHPRGDITAVDGGIELGETEREVTLETSPR